MRKYLTIFFIIILVNQGFAQNSLEDSTVQYTVDFKFSSGIYLDIEQLKANSPIPVSRIVTTISSDEPDFFEQILQEPNFQITDNLGSVIDIETDKVWGYASRGILYINYADEFNRVPVFGRISQFLAMIIVEYPAAYDPMLSSQYQVPGYPMTTTKKELRQFLFDYNTGKILDFTPGNLEKLLADDSILHSEFKKLSNRKKRKEQFLYLRKFNEAHPVFFPKN